MSIAASESEGVIPTEKPEPELVGISLPLEATLKKYKALFKLRDDLQVEIEQHRTILQTKMFQLLDIVSRFFMADGMDSQDFGISLLKDMRLEVDDDGDAHHPMKLHMQVPKKKKQCMERNMIKIQHFLEDKSGMSLDTFSVLYFLFKYSSERKNELESFILSLQGFINSIEIEIDKPDKSKCMVCGELELIDEDFCNVRVCLKCKRFFCLHMRRHALYSLRCQHQPLKKTGPQQVNIWCRRCRLERCRQLGMVDEYQYHQLKPMTKFCRICISKANLRTVCGMSLCQHCRTFFDKTCSKVLKMKLNPNSINIYNCQNDRNNCDLRVTSNEDKSREKMCRSCHWTKMEDTGLLDVFTIKTGGRRFPDFSNDSNNCGVCLEECSDEVEWLGQTVCMICQSFLTTCMRERIYQQFCCPSGELDQLCQIQTQGGERCKYCWFRRLELEGLIDRWIICDGKPEMWLNETADENDEEEEDEEEIEEVEFIVEIPKKNEVVENGVDDYKAPDDVDEDNDVEEIEDTEDTFNDDMDANDSIDSVQLHCSEESLHSD